MAFVLANTNWSFDIGDEVSAPNGKTGAIIAATLARSKTGRMNQRFKVEIIDPKWNDVERTWFESDHLRPTASN